MSVNVIVEEIFKAINAVCDLDDQIVTHLRPGLVAIATKYFVVNSATSDASAEGGKGKGKGKGKKSDKPKSTKIARKNAYHFFVAAKMGEVKSQDIVANERMKRIGEMWKQLDEAGRKPFGDMASLFNEYVDKEIKTAGWEARRDEIIKAANKAAGIPEDTATTIAGETVVPAPAPVPVPVKVEPPKPVIATPVPAPVPTKPSVPAPTPTVAAAAPARRRGK
jgi:hypothetical protein